ncbi:hypothetical protein LWM68_40915 [Niabella sp. W65]|nr:hypothetical protein [Niabella sp. W65]MCH7368535.1 hypothetical protein [Niabella sp. W65]
MEYAAMLSNTNNKLEKMEQLFLSAAQLAQLPGMKAGTTPSQQEVNAAFTTLVAKAQKADQLEASLTQANADLKRSKTNLKHTRKLRKKPLLPICLHKLTKMAEPPLSKTNF